MRIRFLADANLDTRIVRGLLRRESALDFQTAEEAGLAGKTDAEVLETASSSGRLLVTHDRKTIPVAFGKFITWKQSSGVLIVPQRLALNTAIDELLLIWAASAAEEWTNVISPLPL